MYYKAKGKTWMRLVYELKNQNRCNYNEKKKKEYINLFG